jgi:hypothetical protein
MNQQVNDTLHRQVINMILVVSKDNEEEVKKEGNASYLLETADKGIVDSLSCASTVSLCSEFTQDGLLDDLWSEFSRDGLLDHLLNIRDSPMTLISQLLLEETIPTIREEEGGRLGGASQEPQEYATNQAKKTQVELTSFGVWGSK